jgi:hypothetical protein
MYQPSKRNTNISFEYFWKIRMQRQISHKRNDLSVITETGTCSNNGKLNRKKRKIFQNTELQMPENLHS